MGGMVKNMIHKVIEGPEPKDLVLEPAVGKETGREVHKITWLLWWAI